MANTQARTESKYPTRRRVAKAVERDGANAVGKALEVPRSTLLSYLAGRAREGSVTLIEQRVDRLESR